MQLPGCSGHVHQSLWNERRSVNLFHDDQEVNKMSKLMKSYIAGQLKCLPEILPMYAPNINSYKRLVEGAWAPTTLTWAVDNRTTALRAIPEVLLLQDWKPGLWGRTQTRIWPWRHVWLQDCMALKMH
jgi:glutamine synthetase